jgi:hypothetical protein
MKPGKEKNQLKERLKALRRRPSKSQNKMIAVPPVPDIEPVTPNYLPGAATNPQLVDPEWVIPDF